MYTLFRAVTDTITLVCAAIIVLFIYSLYGDPQMFSAVYCGITTDNAGYAMCRIMNN